MTIRFRCLEDHKCEGHGKYESPAGEETRLYNVAALHAKGDDIWVSEGELDAGVATYSAGLPTVGTPGINNWKPYYYRLFDDYERVIVLEDGDEAGRTFGATLTRNLPNGIRKPMPDGYDVTSYVVEHGVDQFLEFIGERRE